MAAELAPVMNYFMKNLTARLTTHRSSDILTLTNLLLTSWHYVEFSPSPGSPSGVGLPVSPQWWPFPRACRTFITTKFMATPPFCLNLIGGRYWTAPGEPGGIRRMGNRSNG